MNSDKPRRESEPFLSLQTLAFPPSIYIEGKSRKCVLSHNKISSICCATLTQKCQILPFCAILTGHMMEGGRVPKKFKDKSEQKTFA